MNSAPLRDEPVVLPPPSLRCRAPARVTIRLPRGKVPRITRGWIQVRAKQHFSIRAVAPNWDSQIAFTHEPGLRQSIPPHRSDASSLPEFTVEYTGDPNSRWIPLPRKTLLRIIVLDERMPEPFRMNIPIMVGPTIGLLVGSWAFACLAILSIRWRDKIANMDSMSRFAESLVDDLPYIGSIAFFSIPILVAFYVLGWGIALSTRGEIEAE